ncbi:hypothetical protein [Streptomyces sp. B6B3]|uniref:hypothetical protein n=1 Tax=Streptomyces sp. B6B3 TaxID=3153570 RepID=UPI00325D1C4E
MTTSLWLAIDPESQAELGTLVGASDGGANWARLNGPHEVLGYPERRLPPGGTVRDYLAARREGARDFTLWRTPERGEPFTHVETVSTAKGGASDYEVRAADGTPLATIRRQAGSLLRFRRARWTVTRLGPTDRPAVVGSKGGIASWCAWWAFSPVQAVLVVITYPFALFGGSFEGVARPRRTRWRGVDGGPVALDYRGAKRSLEILADGWDPRVTAALVVLFDSWMTTKPRESSEPSFV